MMKAALIAGVLLAMAAGCGGADSSPKKMGVANPASVKCIEDGHRLDIRTSGGGGQYGVCIDARGNECEEWAYFRGECLLGSPPPNDVESKER